MPSTPIFQPGQSVYYTYDGKRHMGEISSIMPGTNPVKYNVKLTRVWADEGDLGKGATQWVPLKGTITTKASESDMQEVAKR